MRLKQRVALALLATLTLTTPLFAQQSCTYDQCALRLQHSLSGIRIVQGINATRIAKLGLFAPRVPLLAGADDSTRTHYESFRSRQNTGATLSLVAAGLLIGGSFAYYGTDRDSQRWPGIALFVAGFGVSLGGSANLRRGQDELSRSIWFFNRSLVSP